MGAWGTLWVQFWATLAFQSVAHGPSEQFWDTAGLKNLRLVQFVAHLGAFGVHFWSIFGRLRPPKPMFFSSVKRRSSENRDFQDLQAF